MTVWQQPSQGATGNALCVPTGRQAGKRVVCFSVLSLAFVVFALPLVVEAQQPRKVPRIGVLTSTPSHRAEALRQGLRDLGWVEGQNIAIEWRWAEGRSERYPDLAAEIVRLKVDVIVAGSNAAVAAAQKATRVIPVVMVFATDPVGLGFVASLTRPGGNITGLTGLGTELQAKRLQLLKDTVPSVSRVAVLWDPSEPGSRVRVEEAEAAARAMGVRLELLEARSLNDVEGAIAAMPGKGVGAVLVVASARAGELAAKSRLPTMCGAREYVEAGCLMSYGTNIVDLHRRAASFVDKILNGARPADLPVEQPTTFELVISRPTAKRLGLTIPPAVLVRVDQVID